MGEETHEGKQVQLLRVIMRKAIEDVAESFPISEALAGVPNIKKSKLNGFSKAFKKTVSKDLEDGIDSLIEEEDIDQLLKKREELIQTQKNMEGTIAWRPTGSVSDDMRSYYMNVLKSKRQQATVLCEKEEREVEMLFAEVLEARSKAVECQKKLDKAQGQLKKLLVILPNQEDVHAKIANSLSILEEPTS